MLTDKQRSKLLYNNAITEIFSISHKKLKGVMLIIVALCFNISLLVGNKNTNTNTERHSCNTIYYLHTWQQRDCYTNTNNS